MLADCCTQPNEPATSCLLSHRAIQANARHLFVFSIGLRAILSIVALTEHHVQQIVACRNASGPFPATTSRVN
jgi:hypothetical protein